MLNSRENLPTFRCFLFPPMEEFMLLKCKYSPNRKNFALNFPSPSTPTASTRRRMRFLASDLGREREESQTIIRKQKILSCGGDDVDDDGESVRLYDEEDLPLSLSLLFSLFSLMVLGDYVWALDWLLNVKCWEGWFNSRTWSMKSQLFAKLSIENKPQSAGENFLVSPRLLPSNRPHDMLWRRLL